MHKSRVTIRAGAAAHLAASTAILIAIGGCAAGTGGDRAAMEKLELSSQRPRPGLVLPTPLQRELMLASGAMESALDYSRNDRTQGDLGPAFGPIEAAVVTYYDNQHSHDGHSHDHLWIRARIYRRPLE